MRRNRKGLFTVAALVGVILSLVSGLTASGNVRWIFTVGWLLVSAVLALLAVNASNSES